MTLLNQSALYYVGEQREQIGQARARCSPLKAGEQRARLLLTLLYAAQSSVSRLIWDAAHAARSGSGLDEPLVPESRAIGLT
jgi:hypothetical protein